MDNLKSPYLQELGLSLHFVFLQREGQNLHASAFTDACNHNFMEEDARHQAKHPHFK
jgi:hypothetical protein